VPGPLDEAEYGRAKRGRGRGRSEQRPCRGDRRSGGHILESRREVPL